MENSRDDAQGDLLAGLGGSGAPEQAAPSPAARKTRRRAAPAEGGPGGARVVMEIDPATCRLWEHHNRRPGLLDETSCADLIAGLRAQGRQEFPAIVRRVRGDGGAVYEVICGARRHFAVTWLRANGHPEMPFLVELRDLGDEEAFRLADIENRDRQDISDYERSQSYADALERYYGGRQSVMAARLEVSEVWLSRQLALARLPEEIAAAYGSVRDMAEPHARKLRPLLADPETGEKVLAAARDLAAERAGGQARTGPQVLAALLAARPRAAEPPVPKIYGPGAETGITATPRGGTLRLEFAATLSRKEFDAAIRDFVLDRFGGNED